MKSQSVELYRLTLKQARDLLRDHPSRSGDLIAALSKRIRRIDSKIKAYINFDEARVRANTGAVPSGPLSGIPISVKDNIVTEGWETTCGSQILKGFHPPYDAAVIRKLRDAGAILLGKCNMDEFAFGSSSETSCFGPTRNPWNLDYVPGGSSGGSAASVASDMAIAALGTDTGGSIRQPASFCGVVGLKPTYGRVSRYGLIAFGSSLDQIGPITKTVEDAAILLNVLAGWDERDSTSANVPVPDYTQFLAQDLKGLRIGLPKEYFVKGLDPQVEQTVRKAVQVLRDLGAVVMEINGYRAASVERLHERLAESFAAMQTVIGKS